MGTTLTAAVLEGTRLLIAQVGDSRAYLLHGMRLQQLTRDHSLMADLIEAGRITEEEARFHPNRSVITRAMGSDPYMQPDIYELNVATGDRILLCSDGLNAMLTDDEIRELLAEVADPQTCADMLVTAARNAGGYDNITVIVIDVKGDSARRERKQRTKSRVWIGILAVLLVGILGLSAFGFQQYVANSAYLGVSNGKVTVYTGIPDTLLGMELSTLDHETDVSIDDLAAIQPGVAERIKQNMPVDSLDEANRLVSEYESYLNANAASDSATTADTAKATDQASDTTKQASDAKKSDNKKKGGSTEEGDAE
jgi:protein phosphatase